MVRAEGRHSYTGQYKPDQGGFLDPGKDFGTCTHWKILSRLDLDSYFKDHWLIHGALTTARENSEEVTEVTVINNSGHRVTLVTNTGC